MHETFQVHKLSDEGLRLAGELAEGFDALLSQVESYSPPCRELSLATTKLEEACFYAKKALAKSHS